MQNALYYYYRGRKVNKEKLESNNSKPDIYKYIDYRLYLADLYNWLAEVDSVSYRAFARMAGSTSPNYLQLIRDRKISIKPTAIDNLAAEIGLKKGEKSYFHVLNSFDQAKTHEERDRYFRDIIKRRQFHSIKPLSEEQYLFFSKWYIPIVRELITHPGFDGDLAEVAKTIEPEISLPKVQKSVKILIELGLIKEIGSGKWEMTDKVISTPAEVLSVALCNYHTDVIKLAAKSIDLPRDERDLRAVTIGLSEKGIKEVKERLQAFWQELLDYSAHEPSVDSVYQLNMQLFPVINKKLKNGEEASDEN